MEIQAVGRSDCAHGGDESVDGEDKLYNVISRVKQRQYVLQSSLDTAGLLLPANENLTHMSPSPAPSTWTHTHTHTHRSAYLRIINWPFRAPAESCRVWCEMPNTSWNHGVKSPPATVEWWQNTSLGPHYSRHWSLSSWASIDFILFFLLYICITQ